MGPEASPAVPARRRLTARQGLAFVRTHRSRVRRGIRERRCKAGSGGRARPGTPALASTGHRSGSTPLHDGSRSGVPC
jgi:hypothetical protein